MPHDGLTHQNLPSVLQPNNVVVPSPVVPHGMAATQVQKPGSRGGSVYKTRTGTLRYGPDQADREDERAAKKKKADTYDLAVGAGKYANMSTTAREKEMRSRAASEAKGTPAQQREHVSRAQAKFNKTVSKKRSIPSTVLMAQTVPPGSTQPNMKKYKELVKKYRAKGYSISDL